MGRRNSVSRLALSGSKASCVIRYMSPEVRAAVRLKGGFRRTHGAVDRFEQMNTRRGGQRSEVWAAACVAGNKLRRARAEGDRIGGRAPRASRKGRRPSRRAKCRPVARLVAIALRGVHRAAAPPSGFRYCGKKLDEQRAFAHTGPTRDPAGQKKRRSAGRPCKYKAGAYYAARSDGAGPAQYASNLGTSGLKSPQLYAGDVY